MKISRRLFFRIATVAVLIIISVVMMIIGRGHTIYFDNKTFDYNGRTYETPYKVEVSVKGNEVQKLYTRERGSATIMGQTLKVEFEVTQQKGGQSEVKTYKISVPYNMDGVCINLPAFFAGFDQDVYLSEFVIVSSSDASTEEVVTDEFSIGDF